MTCSKIRGIENWNKNTLHHAIPRFLKTSKDAATPNICYVIMQKVFHSLFTFLCVSTFEKDAREGKNMTFSLCLADEERLAETVKAFPCLYDKTKKGYKERDLVTRQ